MRKHSAWWVEQVSSWSRMNVPALEERLGRPTWDTQLSLNTALYRKIGQDMVGLILKDGKCERFTAMEPIRGASGKEEAATGDALLRRKCLGPESKENAEHCRQLYRDLC